MIASIITSSQEKDNYRKVSENNTTDNPRAISQQDIRQFASILTRNGQVVEVRALNASLHTDRHPYDKPRVIAGWFNNVEALVSSVKQIARAEGIYITINPCVPDLLARVNNQLKDRKVTATTDQQIVKRQYLLLDIDPERKGHVTGIPTNDREHQAALDFVQSVCDELKRRGWPDPIKLDSGNGAYLLYAIDVPSNDDGLIERVLKGLSQQFDTEQVHIDQTTFNQSRIMRLPGTLNCKGDGTEDRPHRISKILSVPDEMLPVPIELLEAIAAPVEQEQPKQEQKIVSKSSSYKKDKQPPDYLDEWNVAYGSQQSYNGGWKWQLEKCPFCHNSDHNAFVYAASNSELGFKCSHNSCQGKHWRDFRLVFEPDAYTAKEQVKKQKEKSKVDSEQSQETVKEETALIRLMRIADEADLICTPSGTLYARVPINSHHEIVSIGEKGSGFRRWLVHRFKAEYGFAPNSDAIAQTMSGVQADAEFVGKRAEIYTRIAEKDGCIYLDLANDKWQCVEISNDGWRVITCPPVYFRRPSGMLPLPAPTSGGSLDELRELINAKDDRDYQLITAWLIGTLHPKGPYPVLNLNGERGSAKTKTTTILRNLVDPSIAPTRTAPKDDREAAITAQNNMVIALDNLSSMPLWLSDLLCRVATGSGFSARELYTDDVERVFNNRRPIIINGIEDGIISQGDLLNRTIMVTLTPPDEYLAEEEMDDLFKEKHPSILGALLSVVSVALRDRKRVQLDSPPRMADFAKWIVAAEPALGWKQGTFIDLYTENQESATSIIMESSPVAKAIVQFLATHKRLTGQDEWKGLVSELHTELMNYDVYKDAKTAPKIANKLSGQLNRIKSSLYIQGIDVQLKKRIGKGVPVTLRRIPGVDKTPVGVDKTPVGVDKTPVGVDKTPVGVDKNDVSTPPFSLDESLIDGKYTGISVDSVDTLPSLTAFYPPVDEEKEEKRERNNGRAVREENLSTPSTPSTPPDDAAIPDSYIYSEPCEKCDCGIYRPLDGSEVCIRCYPPKGYHAYKHLVDTMFPRKQHAVFGKEKI